MSSLPETGLPVETALPALLAALAAGSNAVLEAPPGAGKTTLVPIALLDAPWVAGRILMLEPRRVAARSAAERIASLLGESVGRRVGYRIRGETRVGRDCRIEIVTEGILTRMLQSDPELAGVSALIFDEIHERSLNGDLGLALALEAQEALRDDLRILAMSATLDAGGVARLMGDAPVISSQGRVHPVETRWLARTWRRPDRRGSRSTAGFEDAMADLIVEAMQGAPGSALAFLPGAGEIARVQSRLAGRLPDDVDIRPLYGAMAFARQRAALTPAADGRRKLVLATAIAETSLTIEGVRIVIDGGRARRARFDPGSGMSRLVTENVTRAEAEQRRGRAGRLAPGLCFRLWTRGEEGGLIPYPRPEILEADLAPLALELAIWGAAAGDLAFLDQPPDAALAAARELLRELAALDAAGRPTAHGRRLAKLPVHPRLGHMLLRAGEAGADAALAADLAALLEQRDPLPARAPADLSLRIEALRDPRRFAAGGALAADPGVLARIREGAKRLRAKGAISNGTAKGAISNGTARGAASGGGARRTPRDKKNDDSRTLDAIGPLLAIAYPDRIAMRRPEPRSGRKPGAPVRYLLASGKGAALAAEDPLAAQTLIAVADTDGDRREARIRRAAPIARADLETLFAERIAEIHVCEWRPRDRAVAARIRRMLGALALEDRVWRDAPEPARAAAMADGVRDLGLAALPWTGAARRLRARVAHARQGGETSLPDWSDAALLATLDDWLTPHLGGARRAGDLARLDIAAILGGTLDWAQTRALDAAAPARFTAPTGTKAPVDYDRDPPAIAIRLQELFGLATHPTICNGRVALLLDLLSPAGRVVQTTADLPGFWKTSYADVRRDMRGRYPRHPWPEDPAAAAPTRRVKPRR